MERNQANEVWATWKVPVPVQYKGEINLQAALLLLYRWDPEKQELLNERTRIPMSTAAKALGTTPYLLNRLIETFKHSGMEGVRTRNVVVRSNTRVLQITTAQVDHICCRETLTKHATRSLLERAALYNDMWRAQGCNLSARDILKFYKGAGITLQRYVHELGPPNRDAPKIKEQKDFIEYSQKRLIYLQNKGYDIFQMDESIFVKDDT